MAMNFKVFNDVEHVVKYTEISLESNLIITLQLLREFI